MSAMRKLLSDERKKTTKDGQKLSELQMMFGQVFEDYSSTVESLKQALLNKKMEVFMSF